MSGRPRSELVSEEASAMPQESVRQIHLEYIVYFFVSLSWVSFRGGSFLMEQLSFFIVSEVAYNRVNVSSF